MDFDGAGFATLTFDGAGGEEEPRWSGEFLQRGLYSALRSATGCNALFVDSEEEGFVGKWRQDIFDTTCWSRVWCPSGGSQEVRLEAFVSELPRGGWCVRWSLPYVIDFLIGSDFPGDYNCRQVPTWRNLLAHTGLTEDGLRPSQKSFFDSCPASGRLVPANSVMAHDREISISTIGLIVLACHFSQSKRLKQSVEQVRSERCACLLEALVREFGKGGPYVLPLMPECEETVGDALVVQDGRVEVQVDSSQKVKRALSPILGAGSVPLWDFFRALYSKLRQGSRLGAFLKQVLSRCFVLVAEALEAEFEVSSKSGGSGNHPTASHCQFCVVRTQVGGRAGSTRHSRSCAAPQSRGRPGSGLASS